MTRSCCINGCNSSSKSDSTNSRLVLFEISRKRSDWINKINEIQTLNCNHKLHICELHFNQNDIVKSNKKVVLKKNALPILGALTPTSNNNDNNDCFTDNDNTTMSNNGPVAEMLHQLDPSSIANEHHSHCNITENRASTPEESSTENSILNIGQIFSESENMRDSNDRNQNTAMNVNAFNVHPLIEYDTSLNRNLDYDAEVDLLTKSLNSSFIDSQTQMKTISIAEYTRLVQLIPKTEALKNANNIMEHKLRVRGEEIQKLKEIKKSELKYTKKYLSLTNEQKSVIDCLVNGFQGKQYAEDIRRFCLQQQFHSQAAYESLRVFFNKNLPSKRTIQLWYSSIDGSPGINISSLDTLRERAETFVQKNGYQMHVTVISDEMFIRKDAVWSIEKKKFIGFSTMTSMSLTQNDQNQAPLQAKMANEALVFIVVGPDFKISVAYHLLNGLESVDRAALTLAVMKSVEETGVRVMSLTSDGLKANVTVAKILGAKFEQGETYFENPCNSEHKIYIIFDPPHMLKLIRKHFSKNNLYYQNELIDWNLLRILVDRQRSGNFDLCNKLTQHHINWSTKPMNVRLATQTISRSVADVLEQLQSDGYEDLNHAEKTIEFLRNINDIFDLLNFAEGDEINDWYKRPLSTTNAQYIFEFIERMLGYIENLEVNQKNKNSVVRKTIFESRAHMGFFGMHVTLTSLKGMYKDFVRDGPLDVLYTKQFSQDHLETFFSLIRNRQGRNDNPNAIEFASAFKKLLVCHPLLTSRDHNVITNSTGILTIPACTKKREEPIEHEVEEIYIGMTSEELMIKETEAMDPFDEHMCAYLASSIEKKMMDSMNHSKRNKCSECLISLSDESEKINDALLAKKKLLQPSKSTLQIVILSNAINRFIFSMNEQTDMQTVKNSICDKLDMNILFTASNFVHNYNDHKYEFISEIVHTYLTLKSQNIGKRISDEERGAFVRSRLRNYTHSRGQ